MASIITLVDSLDMDSSEFVSLVHDLMIDNNDVPFDSQEIDTVIKNIIKNINSQINKAETQYNGLVILDKVLSRCSKDILLKHGLQWINKISQMLKNSFSTQQEVTIACKVLGYLVEHCKQFPELHKELATYSIKKLVVILSHMNADARYSANYYLIAVLLYHYPEVCEPLQGLIKKMILLQIDSTEEHIVNASAKCYILLSKATARLFKPPADKSMYDGWTYNELLLCNNLHIIIDELFCEVIESENEDISDRLDLPTIDEGNVIQYCTQHKQRFLNLCNYLASMLRGYDEKNSIIPNDILKLICRGMGITPFDLTNDTVKEQMLYMILPKFHISLLTVLDALISGFAKELVPFGKIILQLFQQTLKWTNTVLKDQITFSNSKTFEKCKPFKNVKMHTYKCLSSWLINMSSLSGIETITNECIVFILNDVTPERDYILLSVQKKLLSKRKMKNFKISQYENSLIQNNGDTSTKNEHLDADLCREALIVLQNILFSGGVLLKETFYENVQSTVISLLYYFYLDCTKQNFYKNHDECRLQLFKVLKALQMNPHTSLGFPIQYYLEIIQMATHDININIAQEAKLASAELEKIIHPVAPTLQLPRQQESDNDIFEHQVEEEVEKEIFTIAKVHKRNIEQEFSQNTNIMSSVKRLRTTKEYTEIIQNGNETEPMKINNSVMDSYEFQTDENLCENISQDSVNISQITNVHCEKEKSPSNINKNITNINNENRADEQSNRSADEQSNISADEQSNKSDKNNRETQEKMPQNIYDEEEEIDADIIESMSLFQDKVKSD